MRWLFALLLLANLALFGAMQLPQGKNGSEPMAAHAPLHADKIRVVSDDEARRRPAPPPPAPPQTCWEWGPMPDDDLARAQAALKALQLDDSNVTVQRSQAKSGSYWVYVPPLKTRQEANRKVEELKNRGIAESFVIQDNGKWHFAVSLGIFSSEDAASKYLAQVRDQGVKSARSGPRGAEAVRDTLTVKAARENLEADLEKLKADFPGSELKPLACGS